MMVLEYQRTVRRLLKDVTRPRPRRYWTERDWRFFWGTADQSKTPSGVRYRRFWRAALAARSPRARTFLDIK